MVQAILDGRKTMTRRVVKPQPEDFVDDPHYESRVPYKGRMVRGVPLGKTVKGLSPAIKCPYGQPGDVLWVRENWRLSGWDFEEGTMTVSYQAGGIQNCPAHDPKEDSIWLLNQVETLEKKGYIEPDPDSKDRFRFTSKEQPFKPSRYMPMEACRLWLKVKAVRVERLQEISMKDCIKEGIEGTNGRWKDYLMGGETVYRTNSFISLWSSINGPDSWAANPWVWVVEFERCEMPPHFLQH